MIYIFGIHRALTAFDSKRGVIMVFSVLGIFINVQAETLLWSEEFNYNSAIDPNVWTAETGNGSQYGIPGWGNSELQNYTANAENVTVDGSNLVITAVKSGSGGGATFTSARIKTQNKLTFKYGTLEARIQTPDLANGLWPAFWTLGNDWQQGQSWPDCGEIDIMEMGSSGAISDGVVNRRISSAAHWEAGGGYASFYNGKDGYPLYNHPSDVDGSFVVYRMEWTPTRIKTYINGNQIWDFFISNPAGFDGEEFHQPHFLILNLAVGGTYTGRTSPSQITAPFPAEYRVDWIRIYDNGFTELGGSSTIDPLPFALQSSVEGGNIEISFPTENGFDYEVMFKNSLTNESWSPIETVVGDGNTNTVTYPATNPVRFYRVVAP